MWGSRLTLIHLLKTSLLQYKQKRHLKLLKENRMSQNKLIEQFMDHAPQGVLEVNLSADMIEAVQSELAQLREQLKKANDTIEQQKVDLATSKEASRLASESLEEAHERLRNPQGIQEFVCLEQLKAIPLLDIHRAHQALHENNATLTAKVESLTAENEKLTAGDGYAKGAFDFARYLDENNEAAEVAAKNSGFFQLVETFVVNTAIGTGK